MSEPEKQLRNFLARWSSRKLAARDEIPPAAVPTQSAAPAEDAVATAETTAPVAPSPRDDAPIVSQHQSPTLPPIESIDALTDIRAFLAPGVPEDVARAALRRAWLADPAIRDFVGIAENQWDFNDPNGAPGFGPLDLTPNLRRMIAELTGEAAPETEQNTQSRQARGDTADAAVDAPDLGSMTAAAQPDSPGGNTAATMQDHAAPQETTVGTAAENMSARRHGSAIPK
jgi:Protein of unknown function (DUF3306)